MASCSFSELASHSKYILTTNRKHYMKKPIVFSKIKPWPKGQKQHCQFQIMCNSLSGPVRHSKYIDHQLWGIQLWFEIFTLAVSSRSRPTLSIFNDPMALSGQERRSRYIDHLLKTLQWEESSRVLIHRLGQSKYFSLKYCVHYNNIPGSVEFPIHWPVTTNRKPYLKNPFCVIKKRQPMVLRVEYKQCQEHWTWSNTLFSWGSRNMVLLFSEMQDVLYILKCHCTNFGSADLLACTKVCWLKNKYIY